MVNNIICESDVTSGNIRVHNGQQLARFNGIMVKPHLLC